MDLFGLCGPLWTLADPSGIAALGISGFQLRVQTTIMNSKTLKKLYRAFFVPKNFKILSQKLHQKTSFFISFWVSKTSPKTSFSKSYKGKFLKAQNKFLEIRLSRSVRLATTKQLHQPVVSLRKFFARRTNKCLKTSLRVLLAAEHDIFIPTQEIESITKAKLHSALSYWIRILWMNLIFFNESTFSY